MKYLDEGEVLFLVRDDYQGREDEARIVIPGDSYDAKLLRTRGVVGLDTWDYQRHERALRAMHRRQVLREFCGSLGAPELEEKLWSLLELDT